MESFLAFWHLYGLITQSFHSDWFMYCHPADDGAWMGKTFNKFSDEPFGSICCRASNLLYARNHRQLSAFFRCLSSFHFLFLPGAAAFCVSWKSGERREPEHTCPLALQWSWHMGCWPIQMFTSLIFFWEALSLRWQRLQCAGRLLSLRSVKMPQSYFQAGKKAPALQTESASLTAVTAMYLSMSALNTCVLICKTYLSDIS